MISVILPTYNSAKTIKYSLKSILGQTFRNYELIVLDDGSTDNTEEIVQSFRDSRIIYQKLPHNGLTKTLNFGLSIANGDIIARMDADDICVSTRFEKQLKILNSLSKNTILSSWYGIFEREKLKYIVKTPTSSSEIKKGLLLHSNISHPGLMCYKESVLIRGGYINNVEIDAFQDYETWLAIKEKVEFAIIPEVLVFQRYSKESLSNNLTYKQKVMYSIQDPYYKDLYESFGIVNPIEQIAYRGWREYFFGSKQLARKYWIRLPIYRIIFSKLIIAFITTFFSDTLLLTIKESRIRFRITYFLSMWSQQSRAVRNEFRNIVKEV